MENKELVEVIQRIEKMESLFDLLLSNDPKKIKTNKELKEAFDILLDYYTNGTWLHDLDLDNRGLIPKDLKRGILSEDGFYNLLLDIEY